MNRSVTVGAIVGVGIVGLLVVSGVLGGRATIPDGEMSRALVVGVAVWLLPTALLIVAHGRRAEALRLREKMLEGQSLDLAFREQALSAHAITVTTNRKGTVTEVNENFTAALGHAPADVEGRNLRTLVAPGQQDVTGAILRRTRQGKSWHGDVRVTATDGAVRILGTTVMPMRDARGRHFKTVWLATDMTKQRLGEEEQQLMRCIELLPDDVYMVDPSSERIVYMNGTARHRLGLDSDTERARALCAASEHCCVSAILEACRPRLSGAPESTARFEVTCDGAVMEAHLQIVETADRHRRAVIVLRDISERRKAEEIRENFMMMMTHELRTPLTSVKGAIQLMTSGAAGGLEPGVQSMMRIAEKNSERLLRLVNDMLDLGKLEAGKMEFEMQPVEVHALISDAVESNRDYAAQLGVTLHADMPEAALHTHGDTGRLHQVLANLLSNAAKFSGEGGLVGITARPVGDMVRISVTDTGPGIPESARATLFDPFTQVGRSDGANPNGTGLGLTIVKAIVEKHGGAVDFRSETGKGTTFHIDLPAGPDAIRSRAA